MILAVAQLFTFEKFPDVIMGLGLPWNNEVTAALQAALLVILEVAALPFLLFMPLSRLARVVSMVAGWLVIVWWVGIALWSNGMATSAPNTGLLGATIETPVGWWMIFVTGGLAILAGRVAWGMWPVPKKR